MTPEARLEEIRARLQLAPEGSVTLLLLIAGSDVVLDDTRRLLLAILQATPMQVADLGDCNLETGPARWVELTRSQSAEAFLLAAAPRGPFSGPAFAGLLNAEREFLRQLAGPVLLLISRETERVLRQRAPDFMTWAAQSYELPGPDELTALALRLGAAPESVKPARIEEDPIRFLHISDLHLRPQRVKRYDQDRVLRGLLDFLERDRQGFPLDLVFVTGDLAHSGRPDEYTLVIDLLRRLLEVTGVGSERLFVVPGNHDVDWEVGRWLLRTLAGDEEAVAFFKEEQSRRFHAQKLAAYQESLPGLVGAARPLGLAVGADAVEIVEVRGARLAVASFNSAWFAQGDDDHGKLWLGEANVDGAAGRIADEGATFAVALLHHPFDDLHELERDGVEQRFERTFDLVLRGHLHKDKSRSIASQRGGFVEVAGPAAYQGSKWPNGCFLGEIRPRARAVRLRPYAYASGADPWVLDTKVFPDDGEEGYCRTFTVPEKRRVGSAAAQRLARDAEARVRTAPASVQRTMAEQLGVGTGNEQISQDFVEQVVKAAVAQGLDPRRLEHLLRVNLPGNVATGTVVYEHIHKMLRQGEAKHVLRTDPQYLKEALSCIPVLLRRLRASPWELGGKDWFVRTLLGVAIGSLVNGPVRVLPQLPDGTHPYVLIGSNDDPAEQRAVIEVGVVYAPARPETLARLDRHLHETSAGQGALILLRNLEQEPPSTLGTLETPAGHKVLYLR